MTLGYAFSTQLRGVRHIGLTDLVKSMAQSNDRDLPYDFQAFTSKIERFQPGVLAFTSKEAGKVYARFARRPAPNLGLQDWTIAGRAAFVWPSPSGANRTPTDPPRLEWWRRLAELVRTGNSPSAETQ